LVHCVPIGSADLWPTGELCPASAGCWGWQLTPGHGPSRPCDSCEGYVSAYDQGAGLVSLKGIVDQVAVAEPGGISFGLLSPGDVQARSISIRNISSQELTIVPGGNLQGPLGAVTSGIEASDGELSIAPGESVTLGVRLTAPADQGQYSGSLIFFDKQTSAPVAHAALAFVVKKGS
jgi:hypothetical protein